MASPESEIKSAGFLNLWETTHHGVQLARLPEDIRIGKLVRETEDQLIMVECFDPATNRCRLDGCCKLKAALAKARKAFYDSLDAHTLSSLVSGPQRSRMMQVMLP